MQYGFEITGAKSKKDEGQEAPMKAPMAPRGPSRTSPTTDQLRVRRQIARTASAASEMLETFLTLMPSARDAEILQIWEDVKSVRSQVSGQDQHNALNAVGEVVVKEIESRGLTAVGGGFASDFEGGGMLHALWIKFRNWLIGHNGYNDSYMDAFASRTAVKIPNVTEDQITKFLAMLNGIGYTIDRDEAHDILLGNGGFKEAMDTASVREDRYNDVRGYADLPSEAGFGLSELVETTDATDAIKFPGYWVNDGNGWSSKAEAQQFVDKIRRSKSKDRAQQALDEKFAEQAAPRPDPQGPFTHWKANRASEETTMDTSTHREAALLAEMASAPLDRQRQIAGELGQITAARSAAFDQDRELDLGGAVIRDTLTPVLTASLHTSATDWMDEGIDAPESGSVQRDMTAAASRWFIQTSAAVKGDAEEYQTQAQGMAHVLAGAHAPLHEVAADAFLRHAMFLNRQAATRVTDTDHVYHDCDACNGKGEIGVWPDKKSCSACGGSGADQEKNASRRAMIDNSTECPECGGSTTEEGGVEKCDDCSWYSAPDDDGKKAKLAVTRDDQGSGYANFPTFQAVVWKDNDYATYQAAQGVTDPAKLREIVMGSYPSNEVQIDWDEVDWQELVDSGLEDAAEIADYESKHSSLRRMAAQVVYHESYGNVSRAQLAAYRKFNVSPSDHDSLADRYGADNHEAITKAVKQFSSRNGMFSVFDMWDAGSDDYASSSDFLASARTAADGTYTGPAAYGWDERCHCSQCEEDQIARQPGTHIPLSQVKQGADADINPYPANEQAGYAETGLPPTVPVEGYDGEFDNFAPEVAPENAAAQTEEEGAPMPGFGEAVTGAVDAGMRSAMVQWFGPIHHEARQVMGGRSISDIAWEIQEDWPKVNFGAVPYLDAMKSLNTINDRYYEDDGKSIVLYFLNNASSYRGEKAKAIKAELRAMVKGGSKTAAEYGEQTTCGTCGSDIEFHGDAGWLDRGSNTYCDESGQHPIIDGGDGGYGDYPHVLHSPGTTASKTAADGEGGGSTCATCGDSIARDPEGEANCTWHHTNGTSHDHEASPSGESKESAKVAHQCGYCLGSGSVANGAPGMDLGPGFDAYLDCPMCKGTGEVSNARDRDRKPYFQSAVAGRTEDGWEDGGGSTAEEMREFYGDPDGGDYDAEWVRDVERETADRSRQTDTATASKVASGGTQGIAIYPDKRVENVTLSDLQAYQAIVGGYIEPVTLSDGSTLYVNEEYLYQFGPDDFNSIATDVAGLGGRPEFMFRQPILGPAVLVGPIDSEGDDTDVTDVAKRWVQRVAREASLKTAGTDPEDQSGEAESGLPTPQTQTDTMWPWELPEGETVDGQGAADVASVPTPGQNVADYPQPKGASVTANRSFPGCPPKVDGWIDSWDPGDQWGSAHGIAWGIAEALAAKGERADIEHDFGMGGSPSEDDITNDESGEHYEAQGFLEALNNGSLTVDDLQETVRALNSYMDQLKAEGKDY